MEKVDEAVLIKQILDGEQKAFSVLLQRYQRPVHSMILQIVRSREDAEELTQDVFVKIYTKLGTFRGGSGLSTWMYRIAYNTAISSTRKKKMILQEVDDTMLNNIPDKDVNELLDRENDEELLKNMQAAIDKLLPDERALITLYYNQDKPVAEIAEITGLTVDNVKVKLFRIRKKIVYLINQSQS